MAYGNWGARVYEIAEDGSRTPRHDLCDTSPIAALRGAPGYGAAYLMGYIAEKHESPDLPDWMKRMHHAVIVSEGVIICCYKADSPDVYRWNGEAWNEAGLLEFDTWGEPDITAVAIDEPRFKLTARLDGDEGNQAVMDVDINGHRYRVEYGMYIGEGHEEWGNHLTPVPAGTASGTEGE